MGNTNKNGDALEKKRERDRRRRERIKNDPEMYREYRESERERYLRRKQEKKALPISELPIQKQKIVRQRNREAARAFYQRLKAKRLQTEVNSEPGITLPLQTEQSQVKDPLTLPPALECSRYDLRSGHRDMTDMGPEITISADSQGSCSLLVPHSSTALMTLSTLIKTSGSDLEQNLERYSDNASSENEKFIPRSTHKNGDARGKKRERDRRRRERIKNDPKMYREFRESERERYLRRNQEKKALPISELPIQKQKIVRQRNREAARAFYQRLKAKRLQTEVKSEPEITLPLQTEQSQVKDPLTLPPALECSRYDLRSGHRDMTDMGPEKTISADSQGSSSLLIPHSSTALTTLSTLIKTSGSDLEQNLERYSDNASSENEKFIPRSTHKNGDAREKKRERDRRRRERIKNDPKMYREYRESERERYLRRKQEKKALPISELPIQKQKIVRQRNREAARAFYQRLKAKRLQTEVITLPQQTGQSQVKDPLTLPPALECSRYDLRSGHRDMTDMGPEITISADSQGSSSLLVPHSSTALTTLSTLIKTSGSDLEQNLERYSDNASSENEKFIPRSTPTSCSDSSHLRVNAHSFVCTCNSETSKVKIKPNRQASPSRLLLLRYRREANKEINHLNKKISDLKIMNNKYKKQIQWLRKNQRTNP